MAKKCVMRGLRHYSLLENTFLFLNFVEVNLSALVIIHFIIAISVTEPHLKFI